MGRAVGDRLSTSATHRLPTGAVDLPSAALLEALRDTADAALLEALTGLDGARLVGRLLDVVVTHSAAAAYDGPEVVLRFELERRGALVHTASLLVDQRGVVVLGDEVRPPARARRVTIRTSVLRFARLVTNERDAVLELLAGRLTLVGEEIAVLAAGRVLRVPDRAAPLVDPGALDPVAVATVLRGVPTDQLRAVMTGPFRPVVLDEVFRRLPEHVSPRVPSRVRAAVVFRLAGAPDGGHDRYVVDLADGVATTRPLPTGTADDPSQRRDATITCSGEDFLRVATGHLNPLTGVLRGLLRVRGDRAKALLLSSAIDIPRPS